jgi:hypothetical protein
MATKKMTAEDKADDRQKRAVNYQQGLGRLAGALKGFEALTGIDLTADTDVSGRHMGEAPYLKITAERLVEITRKIEGDIWQASEALAEIAEPCVVLPFARPVLSARRPGLVTS